MDFLKLIHLPIEIEISDVFKDYFMTDPPTGFHRVIRWENMMKDPFGAFRYIVERIIEEQCGVSHTIGLGFASLAWVRTEALFSLNAKDRFMRRLDRLNQRETDIGYLSQDMWRTLE